MNAYAERVLSPLSGKKILIAPLDWGLGHATRCVPIIRRLAASNEVTIAVTPEISAVMNAEFSDLRKVPVTSYGIRYSKVLPVFPKLLFSLPRLLRVIRREQREARKIADDLAIDVIVSDNRYGFFTGATHNIFITHQLAPRTGWLSFMTPKWSERLIQAFDDVWVPDYESESNALAGELSHPKNFPKQVSYIGPLSRLPNVTSASRIAIDVLFLISGPEPQRTIFEQIARRAAILLRGRICIVRGSTGWHRFPAQKTEIYDLPDAETLSGLIARADLIVCRSGYSTLMDLHLLGKQRLMLVPTPGQTEQEYLAKYWSGKFGAEKCQQKNLFTRLLQLN